ncbi:MAG: ATP-binding cassette domain-containing protein, partial [Candidatus Hydrogenedentes bacterium]|nr:ATP-binding cassette domain-containing protein [Candidatus Hydrogenedentota bacterium]
ALENVMIPGLLGSETRRETEIKARDLIEKVGLGTRANHRPAELSGGEQQRVALARALVNDPPIVLADEPTGNLDSRASGSIVNLLREFNTNRNLTILVVTHNPSVSVQMDRIVTMRDGRMASKL